MGKGKRAKKKENIGGKIFIFILLIVVLFATIILGKKFIGNRETKENNTISSNKGTEYDAIISYYDEDEGRKININDGQIYNKSIIVLYSKGTAKISKDNQTYTAYNGEELKDGTYTIIVEGEDGTSTKRAFIIDTQPPKIIGVDQEVYKTRKRYRI